MKFGAFLGKWQMSSFAGTARGGREADSRPGGDRPQSCTKTGGTNARGHRQLLEKWLMSSMCKWRIHNRYPEWNRGFLGGDGGPCHRRGRHHSHPFHTEGGGAVGHTPPDIIKIASPRTMCCRARPIPLAPYTINTRPMSNLDMLMVLPSSGSPALPKILFAVRRIPHPAVEKPSRREDILHDIGAGLSMMVLGFRAGPWARGRPR